MLSFPFKNLAILICLMGSFSRSSFSQSPQTKQLFDFGWRFHRGGAQGAEQPNFPDSTWHLVDLPHDWSIEDLPHTHTPFDSNANTQVSGGFTTGGTGWYRKTFIVPATDSGRKIYIQFEGVYMNADVWLNGHHLGNHPYGYTSFWYDLTPNILWGEKNVLAVEVKNEGLNSRWYSGSGIYRHVWLYIENKIHIAQWGVAIQTLSADHHSSLIHIQTTIHNETSTISDVRVVSHILDTSHQEIAYSISHQQIHSHTQQQATQYITILHPHLWSLDSPYLYTAKVEVYAHDQLVDQEEIKFGVRTISFDAINGFRLNGQPIKLRGGCVHHDNGPLGARAYDRAEQRRVALLKASGFNAIRCAHNPPSPAFLSACDSLGMLVIDEAFDMWEDAKTPYDYHLYFDQWWKKDLQSMILRDRNHTCIIMWSIGNEIPNATQSRVADIAHQLAAYVHKLDSTRPVVAAMNDVSEQKNVFFSALDICGYNYAKDHYLSDHRLHPYRIMLATESFPLDAFDYWTEAEAYPWVIGDFVWTAWDYLGEASIGWRGYPQKQNFYPWHLAYCGDIDICGWRRPQSYYREVLWEKDRVALFVKSPQASFPLNPERMSWSRWGWEDVVASWNWDGYEGEPLEVHVYSSCDSVELILNGQSLGKKKTDRFTRYMAIWRIPYVAGRLEAVGFDGGKRVDTAWLQTAGMPAQIRLTADRKMIRADGEDLSYVTVEVCDQEGIRCPEANNLIKFSLEGPGEIIAVGNANPISTESYQMPQRRAWRGRCLVVVKSTHQTGTIMLKAISEGLPASSINIRAE
ncbi:MAG: DUF4982 domain-containing protein [Thermoflavifilum sp.]|nr:DUF4982 domain-containing protein [Thermoflavifilum sp.]